MIGGFIPPTSGNLWFLDQNITNKSATYISRMGLIRTDKEAIQKDMETVLDYFPVLKDRLHMPAN